VNVCYPLAVWTLEDLISSVGSIDRGAAIKALSTWVDHGVLKEDPENTFILLEKAEEGDPDVGMTREARVLGSFSLVLFKSLLASFSFHRYGDKSADYIVLTYSVRRSRLSSSFYHATTTGRANASLLEG
jgi:hypothetical protein